MSRNTAITTTTGSESSAKKGRFEGSGTELVGGVTISLGPPRSLIQLKTTTISCDVILRDFNLLDYAFGFSQFESGWKLRTGQATAGADFTFNFVDRFTRYNRVVAQCIPLDIPALCLDQRARAAID